MRPSRRPRHLVLPPAPRRGGVARAPRRARAARLRAPRSRSGPSTAASTSASPSSTASVVRHLPTPMPARSARALAELRGCGPARLARVAVGLPRLPPRRAPRPVLRTQRAVCRRAGPADRHSPRAVVPRRDDGGRPRRLRHLGAAARGAAASDRGRGGDDGLLRSRCSTTCANASASSAGSSCPTASGPAPRPARRDRLRAVDLGLAAGARSSSASGGSSDEGLRPARRGRRRDLPSPTPTLVIGGGGSQREALRALGDRLGLGDRLRLVGPLDEAGSTRGCGVPTSSSMPSRREAFGIVALEAWRAGTALVATSSRRPGVVRHRRRRRRPRRPGEHRRPSAGPSRQLLRDPARRARLAAAGRESARRYTWPAVAAGVSRLYERVGTRI